MRGFDALVAKDTVHLIFTLVHVCSRDAVLAGLAVIGNKR